METSCKIQEKEYGKIKKKQILASLKLKEQCISRGKDGEETAALRHGTSAHSRRFPAVRGHARCTQAGSKSVALIIRAMGRC